MTLRLADMAPVVALYEEEQRRILLDTLRRLDFDTANLEDKSLGELLDLFPELAGPP